MKISEQANYLRDALQEWAGRNGGSVAIVSNLRELWNTASIQSQSPRILICFSGAKARGTYSRINVLHREERTWTVAVTRGRGFSTSRGDTLSSTVGQAEPFWDSVETVRDLCRYCTEISAEGPLLDYTQIRPMQLGNLVIDGYLIEFSTANDIPSPVLQTTN